MSRKSEPVQRIDSKKGVSLNILDLGLNTSTQAGKQMLSMIPAIAQFERNIMMAKHQEGTQWFNTRPKYRDRQSSAQVKPEDVVRLISHGLSKQETANTLNINVSKVYQMLKNTKQGNTVGS